MRWNAVETAGWGRVLRNEGPVARPERASAVAAIVAEEPAPAMGNCRSYGDACLNTEGASIDMTRLDRILSFDPETGLLEVEAGATIGALQRLFAPKGWLPPVMPGTGFATVGGCIAQDVHGKNHHGAGSFGNHVEELTLLTVKGKKVISATKQAALFKATLGGLGQTGVILQAKIRMLRAKGDMIVLTERRISDFDEFLTRLAAADATYTVGWIDATATGASLGRGILEEGETGSGLVPRPKRSKRVPMDAPAATLSNPVVKAFNAAYWRRVPTQGRSSCKPIEAFFFPLDKIHDWNRLYGKAGFHQFQCVVPVGAADALRAMIEKIAHARLASPLAVLKRMGPGRGGPMSFPMEGYTLAVDFPNRGHAERLIRQLNEMTADAGGRIYFAKDALATPDMIDAMYPERVAWAKTVNAADPERAFETDLVRRLDLRRAS